VPNQAADTPGERAHGPDQGRLGGDLLPGDRPTPGEGRAGRAPEPEHPDRKRGKITTLKGGVPIVIDGQVVGAVGVGGGNGEQDAEVAKAGIQALLDGLAEKK
jgi:hypothetical protein